jgi:hypothetical protein
MSEDTMDMNRRSLLQLAASTLVAGSVVQGTRHTTLEAQAAQPPGKPGEFDFLAGQWTIAHRRLKTPGTTDWDEFAGEATCWSILGGIGSIEELRIPARKFSGMGLRLLDVERKVWSDFWVNAASGVLTTPGTTGGFVDGVGVFEARDTDDGTPIVVRGVWDRITPRSCRWHQTVSRDAGKTWQPNWFMDWTRV